MRERCGKHVGAYLGNPNSPLGREWFRSPIFRSSNPLLPLRGGVYPSPYPLPWTWMGGGREVSERPFWLKMAPRGPQEAQDGF